MSLERIVLVRGRPSWAKVVRNAEPVARMPGVRWID
jgi:hypothetical protein